MKFTLFGELKLFVLPDFHHIWGKRIFFFKSFTVYGETILGRVSPYLVIFPEFDLVKQLCVGDFNTRLFFWEPSLVLVSLTFREGVRLVLITDLFVAASSISSNAEL